MDLPLSYTDCVSAVLGAVVIGDPLAITVPFVAELTPERPKSSTADRGREAFFARLTEKADAMASHIAEMEALMANLADFVAAGGTAGEVIPDEPVTEAAVELDRLHQELDRARRDYQTFCLFLALLGRRTRLSPPRPRITTLMVPSPTAAPLRGAGSTLSPPSSSTDDHHPVERIAA